MGVHTDIAFLSSSWPRPDSCSTMPLTAREPRRWRRRAQTPSPRRRRRRTPSQVEGGNGRRARTIHLEDVPRHKGPVVGRPAAPCIAHQDNFVAERRRDRRRRCAADASVADVREALVLLDGLEKQTNRVLGKQHPTAVTIQNNIILARGRLGQLDSAALNAELRAARARGEIPYERLNMGLRETE